MPFMMDLDVSHRSTVMDQAKRLKLGAIFFAIFWTLGMLWWSGEFHAVNIVILTICGAVGGYLWYLAMNWMFQALRLHPQNGDRSEVP
jgi:hypothetical protein